MATAVMISRESVSRYLLPRCWLLLAVFVLVAIAGKLPTDHFAIDLLDHFFGYCLVVVVLVALLSLTFLKNRLLSRASCFGAGLVAATTLIPMMGHLGTSSQAHGLRVKVLTANVLAGNPDVQRIGELIDEENPDILAIIELSQHKLDNIPALSPGRYPYRFVRPTDFPTGIGIFSRYPLHDAHFVDPAGDEFGFIAATLSIDGKNYQVRIVHPFPPVDQTGYLRRRQVYQALESTTVNSEQPRLVIGDFNSTLWSNDMIHLLRSLDLKAHWRTPTTWPAFPLIPKIAIDHVLISRTLDFASIRRGPAIGSDHYPVIVELYL